MRIFGAMHLSARGNSFSRSTTDEKSRVDGSSIIAGLSFVASASRRRKSNKPRGRDAYATTIETHSHVNSRRAVQAYRSYNPTPMTIAKPSTSSTLSQFLTTRATVLLGIDGMVSPRNEHAIEASLAKLPG